MQSELGAQQIPMGGQSNQSAQTREEDNPKKYQFSEEVNFYVDLLADDFCDVDE